MNLSILDWGILLAVVGFLMWGVLLAKRQMKSVADFLAANRTAGRYLLSICGGIAGLGAISIVRDLEMNYIAGFSLSWWGLTMSVVVLVVTVSGWVIYRFRQTRCLTLAEFFERRYSRRFRIFAGFIVFFAGIVNFGIFPAVGARFFIHFCGIPTEFGLLGMTISTFPLTMIVLLSLSLFFVFVGGQIAVIVTDFIQGLFVNIVFLIVVLYMLWLVGFDRLFEVLHEAPKESSLINPFDTGNIPHFNLGFFIIGVIGYLYAAMSWQGTQAYNVSATSAHEAKMGNVLGMWRGFPQGIFLFLVPMLIFAVMHHAHFSGDAAVVSGTLESIGADLPEKAQTTLHNQMRGPLVLAHVLPPGLIGAFAAVMLAAFISTHDTYLHSWGSVLVQDVIMPFRKKALSEKEHLRLLRYSIVGVAMAIFSFSMVFQLSEAIALYFAVTGAIFAGGSGAIIIGGLYTRWGTTRAAWGALVTGSSIAVGGILFRDLVPRDAVFAVRDGLAWFERAFWAAAQWLYDLNGQEYWALTMAAAAVVYVTLSFLGPRRRFDLDRLLKRGVHADPEETKVVGKTPSRGWRILGMGREFTRGDKIIYIASYVWTGCWLLVFIAGTIYNLTHEGAVGNEGWERYWRIYIYIQLVLAVFVIVWFGIGGVLDVRKMFRALGSKVRVQSDDGVVREDR